jgi:NAD(P)-dependent dehydrogenase (short-subunit alcohol dehydrogenase family)
VASGAGAHSEAVFVTGAARGIGHAIARRFAAAGYTVGAVDTDEAGLNTLKTEAAERNWTIYPARMDVTDFAAWQATLAQFVQNCDGRLDLLVNNAGVLASGEFVSIPAEKHKQIVDVNVTGVLFGCLAAFDYLRTTPGARVLNLCSASAIYGQPELASYSASKFAVRGLTEALELEWARHDIKVSALWPLFVDTAMVEGMQIGSVESLGVHLSPNEVAEAAWRAAHRTSKTAKVHYPIGAQARLLYHAAQLSPAWLTRLTTKRMSR